MPTDDNDINLVGYYNHQNAGDDAFALYFQGVFPGRSLKLVDHKSQFHADVPRVILGGGAVINEYFCNQVPDVGLVDVVGCSFPEADEDVEHLLRLKERLGLVVLRSPGDAALARAAGLDAQYFPDLCFDLPAKSSDWSVDRVRSLADLPTISGIAERTVVVFLSDHYTDRARNNDRIIALDGYKWELADALSGLADQYNVILIPMSVWYGFRDAAFSHDVVSRMRQPEKVTAIQSYLGPRNVLDIVNCVADVVVSMKYHGLVFGIASGKPVVNIGDTRKNRDLMRDVGLSDFDIPVGELTSGRLTTAVHAAPSAIGQVKSASEAYRHRLQALAKLLRREYGQEELSG